MSLDKAIKHGKEHRHEYTGAKRYFKSCRNHGGCPWCERDRRHKFRDKYVKDGEIEMEERRYCGKSHDEMMEVLDKMCEIEDRLDLDDEEQDVFDIAIQCITTVMNRMVLDEPIIWG